MFEPDDLWKLLLAMLLGALIGAEREFFDKPAGLRTNIMICLGSALFTIISIHVGSGHNEQGRIAAQIVSGIGFLGAGAILREQGQVIGLTTAATIWLVAALGMAVGASLYALAGLATVIGLVVLRVFDHLGALLQPLNEARTYEVHVASPEALRAVEQRIAGSGLHVRRLKRLRSPAGMAGHWATRGPQSRQDALTDHLLADPNVVELKW